MTIAKGDLHMKQISWEKVEGVTFGHGDNTLTKSMLVFGTRRQ